MPTAVVALGGNVGDVPKTFVRAVDAMQSLGIVVLAVSGLYGSAPWPATLDEMPPFVNATVLVRTSGGPYRLLRQLKRIERRLGRKHTRLRNAPRIIDLDLITFAQVRMRSRRLTLPHPRAHLRAFVIAPLQCVAPEATLGTDEFFAARSWGEFELNSVTGLMWWRLQWTEPKRPATKRAT